MKSRNLRANRQSASTRRLVEDIVAGRRRSRRVRIDPFELRGGERVLR